MGVLGQYRVIIILDNSFGISISSVTPGLRSGLGVLRYCPVLLSNWQLWQLQWSVVFHITESWSQTGCCRAEHSQHGCCTAHWACWQLDKQTRLDIAYIQDSINITGKSYVTKVKCTYMLPSLLVWSSNRLVHTPTPPHTHTHTHTHTHINSC